MPPIKKINLLAGVPEELSEEWFQVLSIGDHYKIERIGVAPDWPFRIRTRNWNWKEETGS